MRGKTPLPGLVVAAFGLSSEEMAVLKVLRPKSCPLVDCTDDFELILSERPICIVLNPLALDEWQRERLNGHEWGNDSPIFLVTQDEEDTLFFETHLVRLTARRNRTRTKVMKQLRETGIDPFFAINYDNLPTCHILNDGFVVLDIDVSGHDPAVDEIIRISAVSVANFECVDSFETLVRPERPVSQECEEETGITNEMLASAPPISDALKMLAQWHPYDPLVAYNWEWVFSFISPAQKKCGYTFDENRVELDLRKLLLRLYPAYFVKTPWQIDTSLGLIHWWVAPDSSYCEKTAQLLILALRQMWEKYGIFTVAHILQLYQDCDIVRSILNF